MLDHIGAVLSPDAYMPHGMCFLWEPGLLWLHVVSDALTAFAYYSIPFALVYFVWKRQDLAFPSVFLLFGAFILACGTTHVMGIWTIWRPDYWLDGGIKLATGVVSVLTTIFLWRVMPAALALPSRGQLEAANQALAEQIDERRRAEATVRRMNLELEARVRERTAELEASNERLRATLREKEVLLREVHHRVKNNLQVVASLLTLQAGRADPALKRHFQASLERIRAMGRVHEQLYRAEDASCFDPAAYIENVAADLAQIYGAGGRIACRVAARRPVRIPLDAATPLALIVNEAISNAFKHAFPDGRPGEIVVTLDETEAGTLVEVRDNGIGLKAAGGEGGSMGRRLIRLLAEQIGATATFRGDDGTHFSLVLPRVPEDE